MLKELVENLTPEQRKELTNRGCGYQLVWKWKVGERLPTEVQVADLADVANADWADLQREVTALRAAKDLPEDRQAQIARVVGWRKR